MIFDFGKNIKKLREKKGLKLEDVAAKMGIKSSMLEKIEEGKSAPSLDFLMKFASATGISIPELTGAIISSANTEGASEKTKEKVADVVDMFNTNKAIYEKEEGEK